MQVLRQDRVLDWTEKCGVNPHRQYRQQHQANGERLVEQPLPRQDQAKSPHQHDADFRGLYDADDPGLVAHVGQLAGQRRKQEKGRNEQGGGNRAEQPFGRFGVVHGVDNEEDHRIAIEIVVERVEQLGDEQRKETTAADQVGRGGHAALAWITRSFALA